MEETAGRGAMKLLIVVLNYRVPDLTIDCLRSLSGEIGGNDDASVVVVENGSGDDSGHRIREAIRANGWDSWVELAPLSQNLGFSGGNNRIIRRAMSSGDPPRYFLLLNPDTIVTPGAISCLVRFMDEHPHAGIAGSRLEFADGRPQGTPFRFPSVAAEFDRGLRIRVVSRWLSKWAVCPPKPQSAGPVDWVPGAAMLIRREVIDAIGPLDERFFVYFEDSDYCLNARRAGWSTWYVPESLIIHLEGSSSGVASSNRTRLPDYWFEARRCFFLKNHGPLYAALADAAILLGYAMGALRLKLQGKASPHPARLGMDSLRHSVFFAGFKAGNGGLRQRSETL
jgi:N-acetylglucosaminyl-diphospho-decaprenol L-rhamnosyltransferase